MSIKAAIAAYQTHGDAAREAFKLYATHCNGKPPSRVPGMDTVIRLAVRIESGRSIEQAAAREYLYRWQLAIKEPDQCIGRGYPWNWPDDACISIFGAPHTIGM